MEEREVHLCTPNTHIKGRLQLQTFLVSAADTHVPLSKSILARPAGGAQSAHANTISTTWLATIRVDCHADCTRVCIRGPTNS
jgi:hypothetical protein